MKTKLINYPPFFPQNKGVYSQADWIDFSTATFRLQHFALLFVLLFSHLPLKRELYSLYPVTPLLVRLLSSRQLSCGNNSKQTPSGHRYAGD